VPAQALKRGLWGSFATDVHEACRASELLFVDIMAVLKLLSEQVSNVSH
jgi:hypothetical protein